VARQARPRPALFIAVSLLLVASGIAFSRSEFGRQDAQGEGTGSGGVGPVQAARRVATETAQLHAQLELAARRFLPFFFRYEVGDIDAEVRRGLHATATPEFAAALLEAPPRPPSGRDFPPTARLRSLSVDLAETAAFRAFVNGSALRGGIPETFSFEFQYGQGRWRASGVTE
jgi:hypothetical protein